MEAVEAIEMVEFVLYIVVVVCCIALVALFERVKEEVMARVYVHESVFPERIAEAKAEAKAGIDGVVFVSDCLCELLDKVVDDGR